MHAVQTENLTLCLGENEALSDITCCLQEGEFLAVLGPNGAGKSAFLKVLLGLIPPTSGKAYMFERTPGKVPPEWIGYVPQIKTLDRGFPAIALELVITGLRRTWVRTISAADTKAGITALAEVGADHLAYRQVGGLSGGELQRVYLARTLARKPRLIMLDEPATGIDTVGETDFYRVLNQYQEQTGATILMVTHDWEVASRQACRVMVLNRRLISFGTPGEALCDECLKQAYPQEKIPHMAELKPINRGQG